MFDPWVRKIPWRREWLPILVFFPGESHGQGRLAGYSPWGCKALDMTEQLIHMLPLRCLSECRSSSMPVDQRSVEVPDDSDNVGHRR